MKFDDIVGIELQEFFREYWGQRPLVARGTRGKYSQLLDWETLNRLLALPSISRSIRISKGGEILGKDLYSQRHLTEKSIGVGRVSAQRATKLLQDGATLIVEGLEDRLPALARLVGEWERICHSRVSINAYCSWNTEPGFKIHADDHDVLILQVVGRKAWRIFGPSLFPPVKGLPIIEEPPICEPVMDLVMDDGDSLYIPRGWWHAVNPCGEATIHFTVGVESCSGFDVLTWLSKILSSNSVIREEVPLISGEARMQAYLEKFRNVMLAALSNGELLNEYERARRVARSTVSEFDLPNSVVRASKGEGVRQYRFYSSFLEIPKLDGGMASNIVILKEEKEYMFPAEALPIFAWLEVHTVGTIDELWENFKEEFSLSELEAFMDDLERCGLVSVWNSQ